MKNKTIKKQIAELNELIAWFDSDEFELEEALEKFEQAKKLADNIEKSLKELKNEIAVVKKSFDASR